MRIIHNPTVDNIIRTLDDNKYLIEEGKGIGEGVVLKNYEYTNKYGKQIWAKYVTADFKQKHYKEMGAPVTNGTKMMEEEYVKRFLTDDIIDKVYANIVNEKDGWESKYISRLLETVYHDLVTEHIWDVLKKLKITSIDFKVLRNFSNRRVKEHKTDIF